jgi:hypothetical protein
MERLLRMLRDRVVQGMSNELEVMTDWVLNFADMTDADRETYRSLVKHRLRVSYARVLMSAGAYPFHGQTVAEVIELANTSVEDE